MLFRVEVAHIPAERLLRLRGLGDISAKLLVTAGEYSASQSHSHGNHGLLLQNRSYLHAVIVACRAFLASVISIFMKKTRRVSDRESGAGEEWESGLILPELQPCRLLL